MRYLLPLGKQALSTTGICCATLFTHILDRRAVCNGSIFRARRGSCIDYFNSERIFGLSSVLMLPFGTGES
jgi:hypothetical protein